MAPSTSQNPRITPSPEPAEAGCWATPKQRDFYREYDKNSTSKSIRAICRKVKIDEHTGRRWKKQRENIGSIAVRCTRQTSKKLGRPSKISKATCKMLVNPDRNPVCKEPYKVMIEYFKLPVQKHQLQQKLQEHTKRGRRYKYMFVKKVVSQKNCKEYTV